MTSLRQILEEQKTDKQRFIQSEKKIDIINHSIDPDEAEYLIQLFDADEYRVQFIKKISKKIVDFANFWPRAFLKIKDDGCRFDLFKFAKKGDWFPINDEIDNQKNFKKLLELIKCFDSDSYKKDVIEFILNSSNDFILTSEMAYQLLKMICTK